MACGTNCSISIRCHFICASRVVDEITYASDTVVKGANRYKVYESIKARARLRAYKCVRSIFIAALMTDINIYLIHADIRISSAILRIVDKVIYIPKVRTL